MLADKTIISTLKNHCNCENAYINSEFKHTIKPVKRTVWNTHLIYTLVTTSCLLILIFNRFILLATYKQSLWKQMAMRKLHESTGCTNMAWKLVHHVHHYLDIFCLRAFNLHFLLFNSWPVIRRWNFSKCALHSSLSWRDETLTWRHQIDIIVEHSIMTS